MSLARAGDFSEAKKLNLSAVSSLDPSGFSSAADLAVQEALNQNKLAAIGELARAELTEAEKQLAQLEMLEISAKEVYTLHEQAYADEVERLDTLIEDNKSLLDAALGIDGSVLTVAAAVAALNLTIAALNPATGGTAAATGRKAASDQAQEDTKNEVKKMREENAAFQREIVKNTKTTARLLQRIELDGLDTRSIA